MLKVRPNRTRLAHSFQSPNHRLGSLRWVFIGGFAAWGLFTACLSSFSTSLWPSSSSCSVWRTVAAASSTDTARTYYRTLQVQVVHRHGDRSPITPLKDEAFWLSTLVKTDVLERISHGTHIIRPDVENTHTASGRGPFGKLTELGLLQMVQVGTTLRERYSSSSTISDGANGPTVQCGAEADRLGGVDTALFRAPERPLLPRYVRVFSTDFPRTIQSVQGLLVGLFPDGVTEHQESIAIDVRNTAWMIPDPIPRNTREQELLEQRIARDPNMLQRERDMLDLAQRTTRALQPFLASDAHQAFSGLPQEHPEDVSIEIQPLAWNQLAEVSKCLKSRELLPASMSEEDYETVQSHAAWKWFNTLRHPRLAYLSMNHMVSKQLEYMVNHRTEPLMTIWSAHDSTLIGLICAYRLEQPNQWPEYASYLVLELLQAMDTTSQDENEPERLYVRFSLNGQVLRSNWEGEEPMEFIPLDMLSEKIRTVGAIKNDDEDKYVSDTESTK